MPGLPFLSVLRPTYTAGRPGYPLEHVVAALPGIIVWPEKHGYRLSLWLVVNEQFQAAEFPAFRSEIEEVGEVLDNYFEDPEKIMKEVFHWPGIFEGKKLAPMVVLAEPTEEPGF